MIRAVLYLRFSSDNQREESIEGQRRECLAYAKNKGIEVLAEYVDRAFSAKTDQRPDFQRMIRDSFSHKFDAVLVWKLDRFARSKLDSAKYKAILSKNNVRVISATESLGEGKESLILESFIEAMDEYYIWDLREKVIRGMTENALEGKFNGGRMPLGYKKNHDSTLSVDETEAAEVREIFGMYAESDISVFALMKELNKRGYKNKGKTWSDSALRRFLSNTMYVGEYGFGKHIVQGKVPAIVDKPLFDKVQEKLKRNKRQSASYKADERYLLSYKLLCGDCGGLMVGESVNKKNGKTYRYYKCQNAKRGHTCTMPSVPKNGLEEAVLEDAREILDDSGLMDQIIYEAYKSQDKESPLLKSLNQELKETEKKLKNVLTAFENGYGNEELNTRLKELTASKNELIEQINEETINNPYMELDEVAAMFDRFSQLDFQSLAGKQALINAFISKVVYYRDGSFLVYFTCKEGAKRHRKNGGGNSGNGDGTGQIPSSENVSDTQSAGSPLGLLPNLYLVGDCFGMTIHAGTSIFVGSKAR